MAPIAAAKLDPGRTRACVSAVAPSTETCTHSTRMAASRSAAASSIRLPSVSILSATPASERRSNSSQQKGDVERLAAAERHERNAGRRDVLHERQRFVAGQLVGPGLVRTGLLATGKTARPAAIGELPGDEQGRTVVLD
jgi:hypothetical protein